jgi:hypothetical protein
MYRVGGNCLHPWVDGMVGLGRSGWILRTALGPPLDADMRQPEPHQHGLSPRESNARRRSSDILPGQVSNTRRIALTAMAVAILWAASLGACYLGLALPLYLYERLGDLWFCGALVCFVVMGLIPMAILSLSEHNSPIKLDDRHVLISSLLFVLCIGHGWWFGLRFACRALPDPWYLRGVWPWVWLLLPILLTSAVVILGTRQRALRAHAEH